MLVAYTYLLDLRIQFPHSLHPSSVIVRATDGINPVPDVCAQAEARTPSAPTNYCRKAVAFRSDLREVLREFLEVHLLLVTELQYCTICM